MSDCDLMIRFVYENIFMDIYFRSDLLFLQFYLFLIEYTQYVNMENMLFMVN